MAKRRTKKSDAANPDVVVAAFAPETEYELSLDGWILLESLGSPFTNKGRPGLGDVVLAAMVMTDEDAVFAARRKPGGIEALIRAACKGRRPADVVTLTGPITAAIEAAFAPADSGTEREKKSSRAADGG